MNGTDDIQLGQAPVAITLIDEIDRYHVPLEITFEHHGQNRMQTSNETIEVLSFKNGNYERMSQQLEAINFAQVFDRMSVEEAFDYFFELMDRLTNENIPKVRVKIKKNKPKWWTREWQQKKNKRDKMYKRKPKNETTAEYVDALIEFNKLDEKLHKEYIESVQRNIIENPSAFWSYAKSKNRNATYPMEMHMDNRIANGPEEIVNLFADYFEELYVKEEEPIDFDVEYGQEPDGAWDVDITMLDIEKAINDLDVTASVGPDNMSPIVMKQCVNSLVWPLWILHQKTMELEKIASKMKLSRVVPIYKKKGKKTDVKNYRITAISPIMMKIYESAVQIKLQRHVDPLTTNAQHGFRPRRSITTNLLNLSINAHDAFAKQQQLDIFYGDFKNAFDKLSHRMLIQKMKSFQIGKKTARWLFEFVRGREFYVKIGSAVSRIYEATSGVPAGSILGPKLFLIGVNDIVGHVKYAMPLLFADDIKLSMIISSMADTRLLQMDIDNVREWSERNRLPFNLKKCEVITVARQNDRNVAVYRMGNEIIERKEEVRDLGIPVNSHFTFGGHIERSVARARQSMGYIKMISKGQFDVRTLVVLYNAYVRSKLEFGSIIWDPYQECYSEDIESVQRQFVLYALGDTNRVPPYRLQPYEERCEKLGLETLSSRRRVSNAVMAYDLYNERIKDDNIRRRFVRVTHQRSLRNQRLLSETTYGNNYGNNQPIAKMIRTINEFNGSRTLRREEFKTEVKRRLKEAET